MLKLLHHPLARAMLREYGICAGPRPEEEQNIGVLQVVVPSPTKLAARHFRSSPANKGYLGTLDA